jgi:hypothetical protein
MNSVVWHDSTHGFKPCLISVRSLTALSIDPNRVNISHLPNFSAFLIELFVAEIASQLGSSKRDQFDINGRFLIQRFLSGHIWTEHLPRATIGQEVTLGEQGNNQGIRSKNESAL